MMTLVFFATACAPAIQTSGDALCDGTGAAREAHAAALAETTDETALRTGATLIALIDAGCSA